MSAFYYALLCVYSSFAIILKRKRKLIALLLLSYIFTVTINVLWLFLTVPWVGLQCTMVEFPNHPHLRYYYNMFGMFLFSNISLILKLFSLQSRKKILVFAFMFWFLT